MNLVKNKLRVVHIPQVPMEGFKVEVNNEREAYLLQETLAKQHLWLYAKKVIPDYSNVICVEMFEDDEWVDYWNEEEGCDFDEFCEAYESYVKGEE